MIMRCDWFVHCIYFCFTFFHAVSSLSQSNMTQRSSVLLPFDPLMAIDRSYATCYRSEKVRNSARVNIQMKQNKRNETEEREA